MQGIVSILDKEHNTGIESLWSELERDFGLKYACVAYPHFSYQIAEGYTPGVESALRALAAKTRPFEVITSGLGIFTGERPVLFIRIVRDAELSAFHDAVAETAAPYAHGLHANHYGHERWIPHITLAIEDLTHDNLPGVIRLLSRRSFDWTIRVDNVALVLDTQGSRSDWVCMDFGEAAAPVQVRPNAMLSPVYGVDFSGAADAGRAIWITHGVPDGEALRVETCIPARDLPGSGRDRTPAYAALRDLIASAGDSVFGLDFPLSLPRQVMGGLSWRTFVSGFAVAYPTAQDFYDRARQATGGRELRRSCETEAKVPFAAYNLRLYLQTYYGLLNLVAPLVRAGYATVVPQQARLPGRTALIEICPASTLKRLGLYAVPYKGRDVNAANRRAFLLETLSSFGVVIPPKVQRAAVADTGGDAVDSLIAAYATWQAQRHGDLDIAPTPLEQVEGRIYF